MTVWPRIYGKLYQSRSFWNIRDKRLQITDIKHKDDSGLRIQIENSEMTEIWNYCAIKLCKLCNQIVDDRDLKPCPGFLGHTCFDRWVVSDKIKRLKNACDKTKDNSTLVVHQYKIQCKHLKVSWNPPSVTKSVCL